MKLQIWSILVFLICTNIERVLCYKGLFVMTFGTRSHLNFFSGIINSLAREGHEITLVTLYEAKFEETNVKQVIVKDSNSSKVFGNLFASTALGIFFNILRYSPEMCINSLQTFLQREESKENYDYVILSSVFSECYFGYVHDKQIPFMYAIPNVLFSPYDIRMGEPQFPAVYSHLMLELSFPMSFTGRFSNTFATLIYTAFQKLTMKRCENLSRELKLWKPETPSPFEMETKGSIVFINSIKALENPIKVSPPNVIYAGGLHIHQPNPLPQDLKSWCDGAADSGFILFSLGTAVKPQEMKKEHLQAILDVFRSLEQRIIWKWDSEKMENLPPNVKLVSWLPQQDILAHRNIRLFITHAGLFSLQEATYFGVPVLGMPVFGDQMSNIAQAELEGWSRQLKWVDLSEQSLRSAIADTMRNESIIGEVRKRSSLMQDWPFTPAKEVVYWTEYVIRHNGAEHLRSPLATMCW
ncbi:UNVERIFIED_CONTAM: hypothetical protein RMT77_019499 [Armadillidium vulgare]